MKEKKAKFQEMSQDGISIGSSNRGKKHIMKKQNNSGRKSMERDQFWMKKAVGKSYKKKLSGYCEIL